MKEDSPSFTAIRPALLRAAHQLLDDDPKILVDPVAVGLVEGSSETELLAQSDDLQQPLLARLRSLFVLRSRFAEDALEEAVNACVRQYVILGAGLDTFAYRQPSWASSLRIFEVDHPTTQRWKRARLIEANVALPSNLEFCAVDFEQSSLGAALAATSLDFKVPTFFSWLGVTQYITDDAIDATFRFVRSFPRRSEMVFTSVPPDHLLDQEEVDFVKAIMARNASHGEPWISRFDPCELTERLLHLGFSHAFHLSSDQADARYFAGRRDALRVTKIEQLIRATV